jgi:LysM repeat protein
MLLLSAVVLTAALTAACDVELPGREAETSASPTAEPSPTAASALPIYTPTTTIPGSTPPPDPNAIPTPPLENPETYVVAEGDTLYGIALKFAVDLDDIIALNGLADPNDIQVGQEIKIPARD